jgi:hypothetical protein
MKRIVFSETRKLKNDTELRAVALWLLTIDPEELDEFGPIIKEQQNAKKSNAEIAQHLFNNHRKMLIDIVDFNESTGALFS